MAIVRNESTLKSTGFERGVNRMTKKTQQFGQMAKQLGGALAAAFGVRQIVAYGKKIIDLGSLLSDLALQTGLNVETFQALEFGALKAGAKIEDIRTVVNKLSVNLGKAKDAQKTYLDLFERIGLTSEQVANLGTEEALIKIGESFNRAATGSSEFGAALELIGTRSGSKLMEVLQDLANQGLPDFIRQAKEAGIVIDESMVKRLDEAADKMAIYKRIVAATAAQFGVSLIDVMREGGREMARLFGGFKGPTLEQETQQRIAQKAEADEKKKRNTRHEEQRQQLREMEKQSKTVAERRRREAQREKEDRERAIRMQRFDEETSKKLREAEYEKRVDATIDAAKKRLDKTGQNLTIGPAATDRLARIGGFMGGQVSPELRVAQRALEIERQELEILKEMNDALDKLDNGLAPG